ncbi:MAG: hypothetical protein IPL92_02780 [Saprospiraceae bacterium]|nr:hypothetical protein [Candidatus Opimibacter iunctus]
MKYLIGQYIALLTASAMILASGCTLDDPAPSSADPALTLDYSQNLSLTELSWDKVNVTGFKEYILLQSSSPIPNSPTPVVSQDVTVLKRIKEVDTTSFSVSTTLFSPVICFKLYCAVDDRFMYSSTLCIEQHIDMFQGFYDKAAHAPDVDEMVLFDRVNNDFSTCNYKTGTITNTVHDIVLSFPSLEMSTWNGTTNAFGFDQSPGWLRKYDFPSLTATHSKNFNQILWAANVHNQYVFTATDEFNNNFQVLSRTNLASIDSRPGMSVNQNVAVFPGDQITVLTIGSNEAKKYTINDIGKITAVTSVPARIIQPDLQSTCAEGTDLFICGREGAIINRDGQNVGTLNPDANSFVLLTRLTPDESQAVYVISDNGVQRLEIADLTHLPLVSVIKSFDLPALTFADLIVEQDIIYLVGTIFNNSQPQTFILKYPR